MLTILEPTSVPPGGAFVAKHDISGAVFRRNTPLGVMALYNEHCRANGWPELTYEQVEQIICRDTPANICAGEGYQYRDRSITFRDVVNGTKVLASFKLAGSPLVSQEQANERAAICATCVENVPHQRGCSACNDLVQAVRDVIGDVSTPLDDRLQACHICGCSNKAQVHVPAEHLAKGVNAEMMERFKGVHRCWKYAEISNL